MILEVAPAALGSGVSPICLISPLGCALGGAADAIKDSIIGQWADAIRDGVGQAAGTLGSMWVHVPTQAVVGVDGRGNSGTIDFLWGGLQPFTILVLVISIIVVGIRLMTERRGAPAVDLLLEFFLLSLVVTAGGWLLNLVLQLVDLGSVWILDQSIAGSNFATNVGNMLFLAQGSGLTTIIVIILGLVALVSSLVQVAFMVVRGGILQVVWGLLPTAAAMWATAWGKKWFNHLIAWLIAFVFYKLVAAVVYGAAFRMTGGGGTAADDGGLLTIITGVTLMILALVALPAMVRLLVPAVSQVSGGGGGGFGAGAAMALAGIASGAINSGMFSGRGGGSGSGGPAGPQGPPSETPATGSKDASQPSSKGQSTPPGGTGMQGGTPQGGGTPADAGGGAQATGAATEGAAVGGAAAGGAAAGGTAAGAGAAGGAAAASGAAAAGPAAPAVLAAQVGVQAVAQGAAAAQRGANEAIEGPSGAGK